MGKISTKDRAAVDKTIKKLAKMPCKPEDAESVFGADNIPPAKDRANVQVGDHVKLLFPGERMWVRVTSIETPEGLGRALQKNRALYAGVIANHPIVCSCKFGQRVEFNNRDIADIEKAKTRPARPVAKRGGKGKAGKPGHAGGTKTLRRAPRTAQDWPYAGGFARVVYTDVRTLGGELVPSGTVLPIRSVYPKRWEVELGTLDSDYRDRVVTTMDAVERATGTEYKAAPKPGHAGGTKDARILKDRLNIPSTWKHDVVAKALQAVEGKTGAPADAGARSVIQRRVDKLVEVLSFYKKNSDYAAAAQRLGPFDPADGAALILWTRKKAYKLAKKLIAGPMVENFFHPDEHSSINMDWFDFEIV